MTKNASDEGDCLATTEEEVSPTPKRFARVTVQCLDELHSLRVELLRMGLSSLPLSITKDINVGTYALQIGDVVSIAAECLRRVLEGRCPGIDRAPEPGPTLGGEEGGLEP
jgi:hypothetical protein